MASLQGPAASLRAGGQGGAVTSGKWWSLLHDGEQVTGGEDEVLLAAVLDLGAAVLRVDDDVTHVHVERNAVAVVVDAPGAHGDDRALLRLLLGGVRDDQTGGGGGLGLVGLDHDPVLQRLDVDLGSGRHVGDAPFGVGRLVDGSDAVARAQAPAVAGIGRQPVSIGTLPTRVPAAQPGPRRTYPGRGPGWARGRGRARPAQLAPGTGGKFRPAARRPARGRRRRPAAG